MTIKIVSLNIWLDGRLHDKAIAYLKEQDADLILLQEVFSIPDESLEARYRTRQRLKRELRLPYEAFKPNRDQPDSNAVIGNMIISRFPISEDSDDTSTISPAPSYNLQQATVDTPNGKIDVLNLHGVWDLDGDNPSPERLAMSNQIIEKVRNRQNVILAGDTNAKPTNKAIVAIEQHLSSVFGNQLSTTFNLRHKKGSGYALAAVDMLFVSPAIEVSTYGCPDVDISDHLPLIATLKLL